MSTKSILAIQRLVNVFKRLPLWGKFMSLSALATLYVAIRPTVKEPGDLAYQINGIVERNGVVEYAYQSTFTDKFPDEYINTDDAPKVKDMVIILREKGDDEIYFYRDTPGKKYDDWHQAVWKERKKEQRKKMTFTFLLTMGLTFFSYSGIIGGLLDLIPRDGEDL